MSQRSTSKLSSFLSRFSLKGDKARAEEPAGPVWQVFGETRTGASHRLAGKGNQDAIKWTSVPGSGLPLVLAVADGHGTSVRGQIGAKLAVETAVEVLNHFASQDFSPESRSAARHEARERLPREIVRQWRQAVEEHLAQTPFSPEELRAMNLEGDSLPAAEPDHEASLLAYGATLLAAFVAQEGAAEKGDPSTVLGYLQLGDGDILTVSDQGLVMRPLPQDERLVANETTSLCTAQAWHDFRVELSFADQAPALVLVSTDGYANSFRDEEGFRQVGSDIWELIQTDGLAEVKANLKPWLDETSQAGSGDDITVGLICRL